MTTVPSELKTLSALVDCRVLLPGDREYDIARRVWNADIDRRPAAIVQCMRSDDAAATLRHCTENLIPITVRGGGHNLAGTAVGDGAVMIDLSRMRAVEFDTDRGTVSVGGGCVWGDVDRPASEYEVAVPAGVVSHTGVAGLTLGGGYGYLSGLFGSTADHLVEAEVVVADGAILTVNADRHADLFWALKGAGHSFGIVTKFTFRYVPIPGLATVRQALYPARDRVNILQFFRDWASETPPNVLTLVRLLRCPEYWSQVPAEHRGTPILSIATVFYGDVDDEPRVTKDVFRQARPFYESLRTMPHVTLQHATDDEFRYGLGHYWKHLYMDSLPDQAIDTALEWVDCYPGRALNSSANIAHQLLCPFELIGGTSVPQVETNSIGGNREKFSGNIGADWQYSGEKAPLVEWAGKFSAAIAEYGAGSYINFTSVAGDEHAAREIYGSNYGRLSAIKRQYDPDNVFTRGLVDLSPTAGGSADHAGLGHG